ncbi:MAG TPA: hypothetical protein HPP94_16110 [Desulfuromonadales bacterium]|nr:hypothetical protein [Desulfuromonadales bacterium]
MFVHIRKTFYASILFMFVVFFNSNDVAAETAWQSTGGPEGASITSIAVDQTNSKVVYASSILGGVIKTTNGGASWISINNGLHVPGSIQSIAIDPTNNQVIYVGGDSGKRVFKSIDGGSSWFVPSNDLFTIGGGSNFIITIDPLDSQTIYVATTINGLYKSTNGGTSWIAINSGLPTSTK